MTKKRKYRTDIKPGDLITEANRLKGSKGRLTKKKLAILGLI